MVVVQWKGQKTSEISSLLLRPTPNLELLANQFNNATLENKIMHLLLIKILMIFNIC